MRSLGIQTKRVAAAMAFCAASLMAANVNGTVQLAENKDKDHKKKNYEGVVVWLEPLTPSESAPLRVAATRTKMVQKSKEFLPHVLAVRTGSTVDFPNLDPMYHNAYSSFDGKIFDLGLYPPGQSRSMHFEREGVVRVFCNIHPSMSAVIVVLRTPYFSTTNADGEYMIPDVAPGDYRVHFYFERATPEALSALRKRITVSDEPFELPIAKLSEKGYVFTAHKNKYGRDYMPTEGYGGVK